MFFWSCTKNYFPIVRIYSAFFFKNYYIVGIWNLKLSYGVSLKRKQYFHSTIIIYLVQFDFLWNVSLHFMKSINMLKTSTSIRKVIMLTVACATYKKKCVLNLSWSSTKHFSKFIKIIQITITINTNKYQYLQSKQEVQIIISSWNQQISRRINLLKIEYTAIRKFKDASLWKIRLWHKLLEWNVHFISQRHEWSDRHQNQIIYPFKLILSSNRGAVA